MSQGAVKGGAQDQGGPEGLPKKLRPRSSPSPSSPGRNDEAGGTGSARGARTTAHATSVCCCPLTSAECKPPGQCGPPQGPPGDLQGSVILPRDPRATPSGQYGPLQGPPGSVVPPRLHQGWSVWPVGCGRMDGLLSPRSDANKSSASFGIPGVNAPRSLLPCLKAMLRGDTLTHLFP